MAPREKVSRKVLPYPGMIYNAVKDRENNIVGVKLAEARHRVGLTLDELADRLQQYEVFIKRAGINKWENGASLPNVYQLIALCKALEIEDGLSYFMGDMAKRQQLNEIGLKKVAEYKADLIASGLYKPMVLNEAPIRYITMPVSTLTASAGHGDMLNEENFTQEQFPESFVPDRADFGIRVHGDSMEPVYHDGL